MAVGIVLPEPDGEEAALGTDAVGSYNRNMANIVIKLKDGTVKEFKHQGRPGGSYTKTLKLEAGFAIVTDEWEKQIIIPAADISEIESTPERW